MLFFYRKHFNYFKQKEKWSITRKSTNALCHELKNHLLLLM